jgi:hypothetical protein
MTDISRRRTLAWIAAASASPYLATAADGAPNSAVAGASPWRDLALAPIKARGIGKDAALTEPVVPWPLTLTPRQRAALKAMAGLMLPADAHSPSAAALPIDAFLDEWVSAPYPQQREDRALVLSGLQWLDADCVRRFGARFTAISDDQRRQVFDTVAYKDRVAPGLEKPAQFFARLRALMLGGFYSLPEGMADIGYLGNKPMAGDYPGPTPEALAHLNAGLAKLGLKPV